MHTLFRHAPSSQRAPGIVLASVTTGLEERIQRAGADAEQVLGRAGLNCGLYQQPNAPIPFNRYCRALDEAVSATGDDNFPLWFGNEYPPEALGLLGYLAISSSTLGEALRVMANNFPSHQQLSSLKLVRTQHLCRMEYEVYDGAVLTRRHDAELSLGVFMNVIRHSLGPQWAPLEVHFQHQKPEAWYEHRKAFMAEVKFGQTHNALIFKDEVLSHSMPGYNQHLQSVIQQALDTISALHATEDSLAERVKGYLIGQLNNARSPRMEDVAEWLKIPVWTLHRRLADEGTSFKLLVEHVRKDLASLYLKESKLSISELAQKLGYSEVSALSRAFQRWYGVSPLQWKKGCQDTEFPPLDLPAGVDNPFS